METRFQKLPERMFEGDVEEVPTTQEEAKRWLKGLNKSEPYSYHIDDNPREIHTGEKRTFTDEQANHLEDCLEACELILGGWDKVWEAYAE